MKAFHFINMMGKGGETGGGITNPWYAAMSRSLCGEPKSDRVLYECEDRDTYEQGVLRNVYDHHGDETE
ncbi:MAG: hypothetical protein IPL64_08450 [Flavobacteriales bacterium]|nr:hypothetical protein [Flavobacteriales bacterium]